MFLLRHQVLKLLLSSGVFNIGSGVPALLQILRDFLTAIQDSGGVWNELYTYIWIFRYTVIDLLLLLAILAFGGEGWN